MSAKESGKKALSVQESSKEVVNVHKSFRPAKQGIIYRITSPSGKAYIGQTIRSLANRMSRHRDMKWGNCKLLKRDRDRARMKALAKRTLG